MQKDDQLEILGNTRSCCKCSKRQERMYIMYVNMSLYGIIQVDISSSVQCIVYSVQVYGV